jgi:hypothetical protein
MSRRIEIELTSIRPDGSFTWRAAGAKEPRGVVDATVVGDASVGDVLRVDAEFDLDGINVLSVVQGRAKVDRSERIEILPSAQPFEAVTQQRAKRDRPARGDGRDGRDGRDRRERRPRPEGESGERQRREPRERRAPDEGRERSSERQRRQRPAFTPPPELPARPKPKRLKPGRAHRNEVLAELPEAQRAVAERVLQGGVPAVRQAVKEQNERLAAEGKDLIPADNLLQMAEQLLPRLRVAEWLDRADAAIGVIDDLDLRDLRSVVSASEDPVVARDETARALAERLRSALVEKQEREYELWLGDIDAALGVGRVVRALKLSSQPPKAGVPFPGELAMRLAEAAAASLTPEDSAERWVAVLEAVAFSPVRGQVEPKGFPESPSEPVLATARRLAALLPAIADRFGVPQPPKGTPPPRPLRPTRPGAPATGSQKARERA